MGEKGGERRRGEERGSRARAGKERGGGPLRGGSRAIHPTPPLDGGPRSLPPHTGPEGATPAAASAGRFPCSPLPSHLGKKSIFVPPFFFLAGRGRS